MSIKERRVIHFSIDDVEYIFINLCRNRYESLFDEPTLKYLYSLHRRYGLKVTLYVYYNFRNRDCLNMVPEYYKREFQNSSDWLRLMFHNSSPDIKSFEDTRLIEDLHSSVTEITRFAGSTSLANTCRMHYFYGTSTIVDALYESGITTLWCPEAPSRDCYDLIHEERTMLYDAQVYSRGKITYRPTNIRIEKISVANLLRYFRRLPQYLSIFTHEWAITGSIKDSIKRGNLMHNYRFMRIKLDAILKLCVHYNYEFII